MDLGQPKLVAELKVRTHLTITLFQAFIRKSNRDVLGPLPCHTYHSYNTPLPMDLEQPKLAAEPQS